MSARSRIAGLGRGTSRRVKSESLATARKARRGARKVERKAEHKVANPWLERSARLGYIIRGLLYAAVGVLALGLSLGAFTQPTDQRGSLYLLQGISFRSVILSVVVIGLAGYSAWGFIRAIFDPLNRGSDATGVAARLGFAWSGLSYAGLLLFTIQFMLGQAKRDGSDTIEGPVAILLAHPFGTWLTGIAGVIGMAAGLGQFGDAYKASFRKDLHRGEMSRHERFVVDWLGRFGMFSRGVIFTMLGFFVVQAALHNDPRRARGMGVAFQTLAREPAGHLILAVVALGFIALGLHSFACARWIRMLRS